MSDNVKADIFLFLKLKQINILKRKSHQGMKGEEQMSMRASPDRREDPSHWG